MSLMVLCRGIVGLNLQPSSRGPRGVTEMGYPMYPPSLYRAISYGSKLGVPMYITENGTPLTEDTSERSEWISGYLGQVCQCSRCHWCTCYPRSCTHVECWLSVTNHSKAWLWVGSVAALVQLHAACMLRITMHFSVAVGPSNLCLLIHQCFGKEPSPSMKRV